MTLVTIHAVVDISPDVGVTEIRGVVIAVATRALEHRVVARVRMAGCADSVRVAMVGREVRVIECCPRPCRRGVTGSARRRESGGRVIRVSRSVVIGLVAAYARRWQRRVVVIHVAVRTGHGGVRARQRESRRVVIEGRAGPVCRAVANVARCREAHR